MKRQIKVRYLSPDHLRYINPDLIDSVTLKNGSTIQLNQPQISTQYFYKKSQNPAPGAYYGQQYVFRGGKKKAGVDANKIELEVPEGGVEKEGLLTDILTGEGYNPEEEQNPNQGQGYYDDNQYTQNPGPNTGNDGYSEPNPYYQPIQATSTATATLDDTLQYPSNNPQESYGPNDNYPPQNYPEQPGDQIPVQAPVIPIQPTPQQPGYPTQGPVGQTTISINDPYGNQPYQPQPQGPVGQTTISINDPYSNQPYQPQPQGPVGQTTISISDPYGNQPYQPQPQYDPYPNQEPQPIIPPPVVPASEAAKSNAPVQQAGGTSAPKSFKDLFKEARKAAKEKIKKTKNKNTAFRARRKDIPDEEYCPYCNATDY